MAPALDLRQLLSVLQKRMVVIVAVLCVTAIAAYYLEFVSNAKVYEAVATLAVTQPVQQHAFTSPGPGLQGVVQQLATAPDTLETYLWQVTDTPVLTAAVADLRAKGIQLNVSDLQRMVKTDVVTGTDLIEVTVSAASPKEAALTANTVTTAYLTVISNEGQQQAQQAVKFLQQQAQTVGKQVQVAQAALAKAEGAAGITPDTEARLTADNQEITALKAQVVQAQVNLGSDQAGLATVKSQLQNTPKTIAVVAPAVAQGPASSAGSSQSAQGQPNPTYQSLSSQLQTEKLAIAQDQATINQLQQQIQTYQYNMTSLLQSGGTQELASLHSQLIQAQVALADAEAAQSTIQSQLESLSPTLPAATTSAASGQAGASSELVQPNPTYQALQDKEATLQVSVAQDQATLSQLGNALASTRADASAMPHPSAQTQANIQTLQARETQLSQTYSTLSAGLTESQVANLARQETAVVTVTAPAIPPTAPSSQASKKVLLITLLAGVLVAFGLALLLEQLDNRVRTVADVERLTALPTLGIIPHAGR